MIAGSAPRAPVNAQDHQRAELPDKRTGPQHEHAPKQVGQDAGTKRIAAAAGPEMGRCASHHENTNATIESVTAGSSPGINSPFTSAMGSRRTAPRVSQKTPQPVVGRYRRHSFMNQGDCSDRVEKVLTVHRSHLLLDIHLDHPAKAGQRRGPRYAGAGSCRSGRTGTPVTGRCWGCGAVSAVRGGRAARLRRRSADRRSSRRAGPRSARCRAR